MKKRIQFSLSFDADFDLEIRKKYPEIGEYRIVSQSLDARGASRGKKPTVQFVIEYGEQDTRKEEFPQLGNLNSRPIIIGAGPAGLFCALRLVEYGIRPVILERGDAANKRMVKIARFWRYGELDSDTNVCYGEGGAGLFSDGKLITRIKSPYIKYVMEKLVEFGAPIETAYKSNPHLGSNKIRRLISSLTEYLKANGCDIHLNSKVVGFKFSSEKNVEGVELADGREFYSDNIILAAGHSSASMYRYLAKNSVDLSLKDFSVGVRIEHPRKEINQMQYGSFAEHPKIGTAFYKLSWHDHSLDRGCYSFCMCPGGYVLSSGTEPDGLVVNGMSNFTRKSPWSNSALVVTVNAQNDLKKNEVLAGLDFQRKIELSAFRLSQERGGKGTKIPSQRLCGFLEGKVEKLPANSCPSGVVPCSLEEVFPSFIADQLKKSMEQFERKLKGFISPNAILMAPETRTSAPLTINRDPHSLESTSHKGLFPCGEGAGYAGGITSAAVDGVKIAMAILEKEKKFQVE